MALTPEQIQAMNGITGLNKAPVQPTSTQSIGKSRADEIRSLAKANKPIIERIGEDFQERATNLTNKVQKTRELAKSAGGGALENTLAVGETMGNLAGEVAGGALDIIGEGARSGIKALGGDVDKAGEAFMEAENILGEKNRDTLSKLAKLVDDVNIPDNVKEGIGNLLNTVGLVGGAGVPGLSAPVKDIVWATTKIPEVVVAAPNAIATQAKNVFAKPPAVQIANDITKIEETIAPKLTSKEFQNAMQEARVTRGKDSFLFGKEADVVALSQEAKDTAKIIYEQIPNAAKLDDAKLYTAIDGKTTELAQGLQGEMKLVPVKPATTGKVVDVWKKVKQSQIDEPEFDAFAGSAKAQAKFEAYLKELEWDIFDEAGKFKKPTEKTLDDIWQVRKDYDASIAPNVKNATSASAPQLQWQKRMWLQNRSILNAAINDTKAGLGETSQKAFSDMTHLYGAKENILSKAKPDVVGEKGIIPKNAKEWALYGGSVIGGAITLDALRRMLGF